MSSERSLGLLVIIVVATANCADFRRGPYWDDETGAEETDPPGAEMGGAETGAGGDLSYATDVYPLLQAGCARCHNPMGAANGTDLLITDDVQASYQSSLSFVDLTDPAASRILAKGAGSGHTGGVIYDERSPEYGVILQWIEEGALP